MSLTDERRQKLTETVQEWMGSKGVSGCPLCREEAWAFDRMDLIVPLDASTVSIIAGRGSSGTDRSEAANHSRVREMRRIFRNLGALVYQLVKLPCENCGYVLLLDAGKVHGVHDSQEEG